MCWSYLCKTTCDSPVSLDIYHVITGSDLREVVRVATLARTKEAVTYSRQHPEYRNKFKGMISRYMDD